MVDDEIVSDWVDELSRECERWELDELGDPTALYDAFSADLRFGTGGIRCLMGIGPNRINRLTIGKAAQGLANWLNADSDPKTVVIGYDTRVHSREYAETVSCVLAANGIGVLIFGTHQPTPVLDFATRELNCSAGVCITASHNPREYNGFKVYGPDGVQATDAVAQAIQMEIERINPFEDVGTMSFSFAVEAGLVSYVSDELLDSYERAVLEQRLWSDCSELNVVYSPLNGTGLVMAERVMQKLGVTYTLVDSQSAPDGNFTKCPKPNPENPEAMAIGMAQMTTEGAELLLANDPDADRVGVACMHGGIPRLLTGNEVGLLLLDYICCRASWDDVVSPVAITTVVTTPLADSVCEVNGVELRRTLTGFKYVGEQIGLVKREGREFLLGIEESDGYLRGSYVRDKDGINALMLVCEVAAYHKRRGCDLVEALDALYSRYGYMSDRQLSFAFFGECGREMMAKIMMRLREQRPESIAGLDLKGIVDYLPGASMPVVCGVSDQVLPRSDLLEWRLDRGSRVLVRPSGTEPKLKCYVFAKASTETGAKTLLELMCENVSNMIDKIMNDERGLA